MEMGELPRAGGYMACRIFHDFECSRLSAEWVQTHSSFSPSTFSFFFE